MTSIAQRNHDEIFLCASMYEQGVMLPELPQQVLYRHPEDTVRFILLLEHSLITHVIQRNNLVLIKTTTIHVEAL